MAPVLPVSFHRICCFSLAIPHPCLPLSLTPACCLCLTIPSFLLHCPQSQDPELFELAKVGLGCLGVVAEVTLQVGLEGGGGGGGAVVSGVGGVSRVAAWQGARAALHR